MAKVQNTFIKSKMNKDLDDRILSKGEYRNAQNINVSKSEGSDVGAMENILGNIKLDALALNIDGAVIIGELMDFTNERIFVMITNYTDVNGNTNNVNYAPAGAYCAIAVYDLNTFQSQTLLKGNFLNFSTTNLINGVNLIEELLFFTDDRNQPRKINVNLAINNDADSATPHYTTEDQISLAKYSPYKTPILFDSITVKNIVGSTNATIGGGSLVTTAIPPSSATVISVGTETGNVFVGMSITGGSIPSSTTVIAYSGSTVTISNALTAQDSIGTTYTTAWRLTSQDSLIKAGMFLVLDSTAQVQAKNIQISYIVNDTTVKLSSTGTTTFANQTVKVYYPTSYTKNKKFLSSSIAGFITSGIATAPYNQPLNNSFSAYFNGIPRVGMLVSCATGGSSSGSLDGSLTDNTVISAVSGSSNPFTITVDKTFENTKLFSGNSILLSDPNPYYDSNWPGDPDYLEDKFVRFAYRFKYEDGEYSLISPFTQPCFIPKQDGFITTGLKKSTIFHKISKNPPIISGSTTYVDGIKKYDDYNYSNLSSQESNLAKSTIVSFFENRIQEVDIKIPFDSVVSNLYNDLKVIEIDVLYKESDGLQVKVLDTFSNTDSEISSNNTKVLTYNYQSRKPFRNLTDAEVVRVYDKIPVRAKTQSVTGNRVVFGNFIDKPTPPLTLDYAVGVNEKFRIDSENGINNGFSNLSAALAYPLHSVKQNRTYQIGIILQDRYGRSSDVVISSLGDKTINFPAGSSEIFSGSTIFHNYRLSTESIYNWFGDSIKVLFQNAIPESVSYANGYPGLYRSGVVNSVATNSTTTLLELAAWDNDIIVGSIVKGVDSSGNKFSVSVTAIDSISTPSTILISDAVTLTANTSIDIIGNSNPLGWYSYKVVVKASEEDYYNAYLPNSLAGSTQYSISEASNLSHITLTADNINKIPSDITEATPEQTQFRSSDEVLFPRVAAQNWNTTSQQINVSAGENTSRSRFFTVDAIGKTTDLGLNTNVSGTAIKAAGIFNAISNPTVAKLRTYGTTFGGFYNNPNVEGAVVPIVGSSGKVGVGNGPGASFFGINVKLGNRIIKDDPNRRGTAIPGWMYPNPEAKWKNDQVDGFTGEITAGTSGWGYLSNNGQTPEIDKSISTTTNGEGVGMRIRGMCIGPDNITGKFTTPFENGNLSSMYWRIDVAGEGYRVGDVITIPAATTAQLGSTYTKWSDKIQFTLEEGHLSTFNSEQQTPGLPISIMEIKPKTSNLDIYWETSTTGLISSLNKEINDNAKLAVPTTLVFAILGLAKSNVYFPETAAPNAIISQFTVLNGLNGALGSATFTLDNVTDGSGNNATGFAISNTSGTGKISITSSKAFRANNNLNSFTYNITATNISLGIIYTNTFSFSGNIINSAPSFVKIDGQTAAVQADFETTSQGGFADINLNAVNGAHQNVSSTDIKWQLGTSEGLGTWSLILGQGGTSSLTTPLYGFISKNKIRFNPPNASGTYTNTIKVTDGSGNGLTSTIYTMSVVVTIASQEGGSNS